MGSGWWWCEGRWGQGGVGGVRECGGKGGGGGAVRECGARWCGGLREGEVRVVVV